jgi:protein-S-isoprenylcysteine O-methyltransferase Ste14
MNAAFRTALFTLIVPGPVTVLFPRWLIGRGVHPQLTGGLLSKILGAVLIALGASIYFKCASDFALRGRGTPSPIDPTKEFVATGLYRFIRNPMYIGVVCVLLGEAGWFRSLALLEYSLAFLLSAHVFVLLYEEPYLRGRFGSTYETYLATVPRWIPHLSRSRA